MWAVAYFIPAVDGCRFPPPLVSMKIMCGAILLDLRRRFYGELRELGKSAENEGTDGGPYSFHTLLYDGIEVLRYFAFSIFL